MSWTRAAVAATLDHSVLRAEATRADLEAGAQVALAHGVASLCVKSCDVAVAAGLLSGSSVRPSCVIGFPHGGQSSVAKAAEAAQAVSDGAVELDMVLNVGWLRSGGSEAVDAVEADVAAVVAAAATGAVVKVILETAYLTDDQKQLACRLAERAGAAYVKTSTGFGPARATVADVALLRASVSPAVRVKASGGIRDAATAIALLEAGADRLGTSSTEAILAAIPPNGS